MEKWESAEEENGDIQEGEEKEEGDDNDNDNVYSKLHYILSFGHYLIKSRYDHILTNTLQFSIAYRPIIRCHIIKTTDVSVSIWMYNAGCYRNT